MILDQMVNELHSRYKAIINKPRQLRIITKR
jgi:hypothetical protein